MQISEFIETTSILEQYYGKELTKEQMQITFEQLKELSIDRYKKLVSKCLRTCKYMPKISDIITANNELIGQVEEETQKEKVQCSKCDSTGYVIYTKFIANGNTRIPYTYSARCDCKNSLYVNQKIPSINELGITVSNRINQIKDTHREIEKIKNDLIKTISI